MADLVIEVADSSLDFDTNEKKLLYARAAIRDYWVVDINERKGAEEALRLAHAEMEARVRERTADLAKAVAVLRSEIAEREQAEPARG